MKINEDLKDIIINIENYNSKDLKLLQEVIKKLQEKRFDEKFKLGENKNGK